MFRVGQDASVLSPGKLRETKLESTIPQVPPICERKVLTTHLSVGT